MAERRHAAALRAVGGTYIVLGLLLLLTALDVLTLRWSLVAPALMLIAGACLVVSGALSQATQR